MVTSSRQPRSRHRSRARTRGILPLQVSKRLPRSRSRCQMCRLVRWTWSRRLSRLSSASLSSSRPCASMPQLFSSDAQSLAQLSSICNLAKPNATQCNLTQRHALSLSIFFIYLFVHAHTIASSLFASFCPNCP